MRSDEKNHSANRGNDITADELLALLNKSIAQKSDSENTHTVNPVKTRGDALKIDDKVYRSAENELHNSAAVKASDDSDLDIDELIEKYINVPKQEREAAAKAELPLIDDNGDEIVREFENVHEDSVIQNADEADMDVAPAVSEAAAFDGGTVDDTEDEIKIPETLLREAEAEDVVSDTEEDLSDDSYGFTDEDSDFDEPFPAVGYEGDEDMKIAAPALPTLTDTDSSDSSDTVADTDFDAGMGIDADDSEKTAVFDISQIRQLAETESSDIGAVDPAFEHSETEVFRPVSADMIAAAPDSSPEPAAVYGQAVTDEIDQTDLNIMIAFGMNDELKDTVGEDQATAIEADILQEQEEADRAQMADEQLEFTSRDQIAEILTRYKSQYYTLLVRIAAALVLLAGIFFIENHSMFGITMPSFMRPTSYPVVYAMIDLQLVVLCGALVARQVIDGVKNLIMLKPTPESITAFALIMSVIYTFVSCFTAPMEGFALYNMPIVFAVLLALVYEFMNLKRDVFSFNVVSSKKKKFVVTPVSDVTESLEREIFNDYVPADSQIVRVGKTDFVDGFFARVGANRASKPIIGITIPIVMILAVAFLILSFISDGSLYNAFTNAFLAITFTLPLTAFVIYSYPFYKASKDSYDAESAIIGESSLSEYSGSSVISFEDKEVFPSGGVKVTSIKVYGNNRIDEIIYSLASAFIKVGGPLADVFSQATHDIGHSDDVELIEVEDDGFTVTIDDVQVYIGKASYMEKKDYDPPYDAESRRIDQNSSMGILFVAFGGQLAAKVYVQYTIDSEFESILAQLYKTGMCVGIKSFDPNIDDLLLAKKIKAMKYPVKVIRSKTVEDIPHTFEHCDSGIVSKRSVKSLLRTVALCERVGATVKTSLVIKMLAMLIGVGVMIFIHAFGNEITLPSLYVMLYQLFWTVPIVAISKFLI